MHLIAAMILAGAVQADDLDTLKKKYEQEMALPYAQRMQTVGKIGALRTDEAAEFLFEIFTEDDNISLRSYALTCLGTCGTAMARKKLKEVLDDKLQPTNFRSSALNAIARTKSDEALEMIRSVIEDKDPKNSLRYSAYSALRQFPLKKTEKIWREALRDTNISIRGQAFGALAPLKDPEVLEEAKKVLTDPAVTSFVKTYAVEPWKVKGGPEAVEVFLEASATTDSRLRKAIQEVFSGLKTGEEIEALLKGLAHTEASVREIVTRSLGKLKHPDIAESLEKMLRDKSVNVRIAALESIAERKAPDCEEVLQREAKRGKDEATLAAIGLLAGFPSASTIELLKMLTRHRKLEVKVTALDALGDTKTTEAIPLYKRALKAKEWQVRAAAIRGLGKIKDKESVDLLIDQMKKEDGRLLVDIGEALKKLTGKALGYSQGHWKDWWKVNRETFTFPETVEGVGGDAGPGATTYYGVPVLSNRIIFCLDISGSMSSKAGASTRLEQAKKELTKVLKSLKKGVHVNMIFFDTVIEPWQKRLVPIQSSLGGALKKIQSLQPRGGTNIYDTLESAFEDPNVDTIYLLSDGAPGSGKFVNTDDILREIKKLNRSRQIVIHTISLGRSEFMKKLSEENGGQYVEVN